MSLIISRADAMRPAAIAAIDEHFTARILAIVGPLAALHALKRAQAEIGQGVLIDGDREAILARAAEQDERLAVIDRQRRSLKERVRLAASAAAIRAALAELVN